MDHILQEKINNLEVIGDPVWYNRGNGNEFIQKFLANHHKENCFLTIFDELSNATAEFTCEADDIYNIVSLVASLENTVVSFIGLDSLKGEYIVGIPFNRKRFETDSYDCINGEIWSKNSVFQTR